MRVQLWSNQGERVSGHAWVIKPRNALFVIIKIATTTPTERKGKRQEKIVNSRRNGKDWTKKFLQWKKTMEKVLEWARVFSSSSVIGPASVSRESLKAHEEVCSQQQQQGCCVAYKAYKAKQARSPLLLVELMELQGYGAVQVFPDKSIPLQMKL